MKQDQDHRWLAWAIVVVGLLAAATVAIPQDDPPFDAPPAALQPVPGAAERADAVLTALWPAMPPEAKQQLMADVVAGSVRESAKIAPDQLHEAFLAVLRARLAQTAGEVAARRRMQELQ